MKSTKRELLTVCLTLFLHSATFADADVLVFRDDPFVAPAIAADPRPNPIPGTDPLLPSQWYLHNSGAPDSEGRTGVAGADLDAPTQPLPDPLQEITIALIDTGIDVNHPDLSTSSLWRNAGEQGIDAQGKDKSSNGIDDDGNGFVDDATGWNFADNNNRILDSHGHGTHLAGLLIAQNNNGIGISSPWRGIRVMPIQIFSSAHPAIPLVKVADAIRYAVDNGARVISASFGTPSYSEEIKQAISYAATKGVLFVCAAGNSRTPLETTPDYPSSYGLANQLVVGASNNRDLEADFSNFGMTVDLVAPGDRIMSLDTQGRYRVRSGTSQACPLVSATAALLWAYSPELSIAEIRERILSSADERPAFARYSRSSRRLNARKAFENLLGERLPPFISSRSETLQIATTHPYLHDLKRDFSVSFPGSRAFRLHFARFDTESRDTLEIFASDGTPVDLLSGELGETWSVPIPGDSATLRFTSDRFVSAWGFLVDGAETIPLTD